MLSKDEIIKFFEKQVMLETEIVESINQALVKIRNPVVKGVLKGISLDSIKHADMYKAAIELLSTVSSALSQEEYDELVKFIKKHIAEEEKVIISMEEVMQHVANEKIQLLLKAIFSDEERHHELLKNVLEILVKGETISEKDWWEMLWKNVPFHGAPGG
jgi:rubrerythrin